VPSYFPSDYLLRFLAGHSKYIVTPPSFGIIASILRAATRLSFGDMGAWAVRTLEMMWKDDFDEVTEDHIQHAAETVNLTWDYDIPRVRRRAFYELLRTKNFGQDFDLRDDDVRASARLPVEEAGESLGDRAENKYAANGTTVNGSRRRRMPRAALLSRDDVGRLIYAREELLDAWIRITATFPDSVVCPSASDGAQYSAGDGLCFSATDGVGASPVPIGKKTKGRVCDTLSRSSSSLRWAALVHQSGTFMQYKYDPVLGLSALKKLNWSKNFCKTCISQLHLIWDKERAKLWVYQLDEWLCLNRANGAGCG